MNDPDPLLLLTAIDNHLRQLAPHMRERATPMLLVRARNEIERLQRPRADDAHMLGGIALGVTVE